MISGADTYERCSFIRSRQGNRGKTLLTLPCGQNRQKTVWTSASFVNSAVPCCQICTPTDCFLAILPTRCIRKTKLCKAKNFDIQTKILLILIID